MSNLPIHKETEKSVFGAYSKYYDLLYRDKDYASEVDYISSLLREYGLGNSKILELGSGTGIHGRMLGALGHQVTGVELSHEMIEIAEETENFKCVQGNITDINLGTQFDCILSLFHVISYLTENTQLESLFRNANQHLKDFGFFIFDVWYSPSVNYHQPEVRVKRIQNPDMELIRIANPLSKIDSNTVDVNYSIFFRQSEDKHWALSEETHVMRHFSTPEIQFLADHYGFELIRAEEFITKNVPSKSTWAICYVLKKKRSVL